MFADQGLISFNDLADTVLDGDKYYLKEDVLLSGLVVDPTTKFAFGAFPALRHSTPLAVGYFDTEKWPKGSSPKFTGFPTWLDNDLPVSQFAIANP